MSVFANSDLLEEIVETTEEHEAELCSGGETVDECSGLPIGSDFVDEQPEQKPTLPALSSSSSSSGPGLGAGRQHKSSSGASSRSSSGGSVSALSNGPRAGSRSHMEQEKRMRREIANSNERRRMQSINAGFQSLRTLLPHHEGEKLSKAAILQQTAEYIYQLEQQKTQLLSQNLQLKRLVDQHEGGDVPTKKRKGESQGFARRGARMEARKIDCTSKSGELIEEKAGVVVSLPVHVSESGDEGLGSMSPEPLSVITVSADGHASVGPTAATAAANAELAELKRQLERERVARTHLEKQMRTLQATTAILPERYRDEQLIAYQPHEVIEHTNNVLPQELEDGLPGLQVVSVVTVPQVGSTQTVETSNADSNTPPLSPEPGCEVVVPVSGDEQLVKDVGDLLAIESQPSSPKLVGFAGVTVFASSLDASEQISAAAAVVPNPAAGFSPTYAPPADSFKTDSGHYVTASPTRPFSPTELEASQQQQRLPSVLEAAIKAEPKVEVERLPSPSNSLDDGTPQARLYLANTSRQNLETIVEAIRHLEGDHLFNDEQDAPLALTNKPTSSGPSGNPAASSKQRLLHAEVNNFLQFQQQQQQQSSPAPAAPTQPTTQQQSRTQQRPGVIVVKHS